MLGSPLSLLACPHCTQHFCSKGGCNQHIHAKHNTDGLEQSSSPLTPPLPLPPPSLSHQSLSPELHHERPPLHGGSNADIDIEDPDFVQDEVPPDFYFEELNRSSSPGSYLDIGRVLIRTRSPGDGDGGPCIPDAPHVARVYHPKLNGKS